MIVTDHAKSAASRVIVGLLVLLGSDQVASLSRFLAFVLSRVSFFENVRLAFSCAQQKAAAFVRISLLAMLSYLIKVFLLSFDCHFALSPV